MRGQRDGGKDGRRRDGRKAGSGGRERGSHELLTPADPSARRAREAQGEGGGRSWRGLEREEAILTCGRGQRGMQ